MGADRRLSRPIPRQGQKNAREMPRDCEGGGVPRRTAAPAPALCHSTPPHPQNQSWAILEPRFRPFIICRSSLNQHPPPTLTGVPLKAGSQTPKEKRNGKRKRQGEVGISTSRQRFDRLPERVTKELRCGSHDLRVLPNPSPAILPCRLTARQAVHASWAASSSFWPGTLIEPSPLTYPKVLVLDETG